MVESSVICYFTMHTDPYECLMHSSKPETIDLLIEARWIATVDQPETLKNHAIAIHKGKIINILPAGEARSRYSTKTLHVLDDHLLIPGLINLHTHAAMSLMRGLADDQPLMTWLQKHIWPAEAKHLSPQFVLDGSKLACAEMLKGGITSFNDMYFFPDATAQAASELNMRAHLGITTLEFPTAYASDANDYLQRGLEVREKWLDNPLIQFCLAPHAPYTVSDTTFEQVLTLSKQLNIPIHCHIHETRQEISDSLQTHGLRPLARLNQLGLLDPDFIGVHAVHLLQEEIELLAEKGVHLAHCPTSNLKLASGIAPMTQAHRAGINIGLGTDGAASNNRLDLFSEMRLAALLAKGSSEDATAISAYEALKMATLNAATALGQSGLIGSLKIGKAADITAIQLDDFSSRPCFDPVSHLVYVCDRNAVSHVWVNGKCCVNNKSLQAIDCNNLESIASLWQNRLEIHS